MGRLIDVNDVIKAIDKHTFDTDDGLCLDDDITCILEEVPTIEERKTGKWIPVDSYSAFGGDEVMWEAHGNPIAFYYCSECKEHAYAGEDGESLLTTYCPNCGARLVQEGEDNERA